MCAFADKSRSIDPRIIGLLRRSLMIAGILFGFLIVGSAVAHADSRPAPPPKPRLGLGLPSLPTLPILPPVIEPITKTVDKVTAPIDKTVTETVDPIVAPIVQPVTSLATQTVTTVTRIVAPVTKTLTSVTTGLTTTVVRTIAPIVVPAVSVTTPVLQPVMPLLPPPPAQPGRPGTDADTPNPAFTDATAPATTDSVVVPSVATGSTQAVVPQPNPEWLFDRIFVLPPEPESDESLPVPARPMTPPPDNQGGPIVDSTGACSGGVSGPSGPMSGISRPSSEMAADPLSATRVRPGTGPPKWWFYDPHHHPS